MLHNTDDAERQIINAATQRPVDRRTTASIAAGRYCRGGASVFASRSAEFERLEPIYANTGIETRYSCVPLTWFSEPHGWAERNRLYATHALELAETAATDCLAKAKFSAQDIDGIVMVSTTGIATPSLDALLMEHMPFRRDVQRLPIFGLGCAGGVLGLGRAAALARSSKQQRWLLVVVELCGLTFRKGDLSNSNIVASALFGDGAAAAAISCDGSGPHLPQWGEHTWPQSLDVMGWHVEDDGFGVLFSRDIPSLVRERLKPVTESYLAAHGRCLEDIDHYVFHPGGARVIDELGTTFGLSDSALNTARGVLRDYRNMSAASVFFVLERTLEAKAKGRMLLGVLGPGFSAAFATLETSA